MKDVLGLLFSSFGTAVAAGYGASFVLLLVILALLFVVYGMLRAYNRRLAECERQHREQAERERRMQKKLAIMGGLIVSLLGNRQLPKQFLEMLLDDEATELPDMGNLINEAGGGAKNVPG